MATSEPIRPAGLYTLVLTVTSWSIKASRLLTDMNSGPARIRTHSLALAALGLLSGQALEPSGESQDG